MVLIPGIIEFRSYQIMANWKQSHNTCLVLVVVRAAAPAWVWHAASCACRAWSPACAHSPSPRRSRSAAGGRIRAACRCRCTRVSGRDVQSRRALVRRAFLPRAISSASAHRSRGGKRGMSGMPAVRRMPAGIDDDCRSEAHDHTLVRASS